MVPSSATVAELQGLRFVLTKSTEVLVPRIEVA